MGFLVKLIEVTETSGIDARDDLYANCTHVANNYWLYEGDEIGLHEGVTFTVVDEQAIEATGDLSSSQIKRMVKQTYNVDKCFL